MSHEQIKVSFTQRPMWVERKFSFDHLNGTFLNILERLEGTPVRLASKIESCSREQLTTAVDGRWSAQVHIGHLLTLESLWLGRLDDFVLGNETLRAWNPTNEATEIAQFDTQNVQTILSDFRVIRMAMVVALRQHAEQAERMSALHPRLKTPMRLIDMVYFIAEHDDHHLASINHLINTSTKA